MEGPNICSPNSTPATSTDGGGAVGRCEMLDSSVQPQTSSINHAPWFLLWVKPRAEKTVRDNLAREGFETFAATKHETHIWRRGERRKVEKVLIPSIVFVRMEQQDRPAIERTLNVHSLMYDPARKKEGKNNWDTLARISDDDMRFFQQMLRQEEAEVNFTSSDFIIGDYVRILGFDDAHNKAQIVRIFDDSKTYVGLRVSFLGCAYMQVPLDRIAKL